MSPLTGNEVHLLSDKIKVIQQPAGIRRTVDQNFLKEVPETPIELSPEVPEVAPGPACPNSDIRKKPRVERLRTSGRRMQNLLKTTPTELLISCLHGSSSTGRSLPAAATIADIAKRRNSNLSMNWSEMGARKRAENGTPLGYAQIWQQQAERALAGVRPILYKTPYLRTGFCEEAEEEQLELEVENIDVEAEGHSNILPSDTESPTNSTEQHPYRSQKELRRDLEEFYAEALRWTIDHDSSSLENVADDRANREWLYSFSRNHQEDILEDVTSCPGVIEYSAHWKRILQMELRGYVAEEANMKWPQMMESRGRFQELVHGSQYASNFVRICIKKLRNSRLLTTLRCESTDFRLNRALLRDLRGLTLAVGYLKRASGHEDTSSLKLVLIRRVTVDKDDFDRVGLTGKLKKVTLSVAMERDFVWSFRPEQGDFLSLQVLCSVAPIARMFVGAHMVYQLPQRVQNTIFGALPAHLIPRRELVKASLSSRHY